LAAGIAGGRPALHKEDMRRFIVLLALALAGAAPVPGQEAGWHLVPGSFEPGRQPDGNSVFLEAPQGLILIDTGRHPEHQAKLLAYAKARGKPIAAVVNTHWHLDHVGGNAEIRAAYPSVPVHGSAAVEGALTGFFPRSRKSAEEFLASGQASPEQEAEIRGDFAAMEDVAALRPTRPVARSGTVRVAGRRLRLNLARFAATEGDVWVHDERSKLLVAGDLVVGPAPFFDTGCPEGWRKALDEIAASDFVTLIPGHGAPMTKPRFLQWRTAFGNLLDCAVTDRTKEECVAGWKRDAAPFIPPDDRRIDGLVGYYLDTRLRAPYAEREKYCRPLR
jgi:glyoxylase-like metal-dependent hydrolase (beta-lactamase superfamily II)